MLGTKNFLKSKTIWGGIAAALGGGVTIAGYVVSGTDVTEAHQLVTSIVTSVGGLIAIYGRIVATRKIGR